tara:strand:- start:13781 stop:14467 length:687 start_codon:yes stop_codon:yes gene_type:complete
MSVNINRVYQKVLALANKEQRGYITPQEFNLFADHAQMEIFEQYFYDLEQFEKNVSSDIDSLIEQKVQIFKKLYGEIQNEYEIPNQVYKVSYVYIHDNQTEHREYLEKREAGEFIKIKSGSLLNNSLTTPIYYIRNNTIFTEPANLPSSLSYQLSVVEKPITPEWAYVISGENALYNPNLSVNFQLHPSEENELVIKILALAGVAIKDVQLVQAAAVKEASTVQQQKQ